MSHPPLRSHEPPGRFAVRLLVVGEVGAVDVFATETEAHNAAQEAFDQWRVADEPYELDGWVVLGKASELACLLSLQCLCDPYRWFASSLHALEVGEGDGARAQWYCEVIGRGDGVGDGVVHPGGSGRRHSVGGVADA